MTGQPSTTIPLVDLPWQHAQIADEITPRMLEVMSSGAFIQGPDVKAFEAEFAAYSGVPHCVGVANGTDALELALRAAGVEPGTSVIIPANTFIATAEAVVRAGAEPVVVDCDEYGLIDTDQVAARIDSRTGAVMPVHLYGQMADMEALARAVGSAAVAVVEDAAQAQGATRNGRGIGSWGAAAGTSFYPGKNLGAYGDGGALLTADPGVAEAARRIANHGSDTKYKHSEVGCNSRLDTLQAVVLRAKLRRLDEWNERRRHAAHLYNAALAPLVARGLVRLPAVAPGNLPVWHLYVVRVAHRDAVLDRMRAAAVEAGIHYPIPVHLSEAFTHLGHRPGDFPVAETMADEILSLPIYPGITEGQIGRVSEALAQAVDSRV